MRRVHAHSGQSMVEFAPVFLIVVILLIGLFDLGRAVYYYSSLSNAVREAARYAIVHNADLKDVYNSVGHCTDSGSLIDKVVEYSFGLELSHYSQIQACVTKPDELFDTVTISATYLYDPVTPLIEGIFGHESGIPFEVESTMRIAAYAAFD